MIKNLAGKLMIILVLAFVGMVCLGGTMLYQQSTSTTTADMKVDIKKDSLSFELKNALPGLVVFLCGAVGLILLMFRVPVREVLQQQMTDGAAAFNFRIPQAPGFRIPEPRGIRHDGKLLSEHTMSMPILIWWLLKWTGRLEKALQS
jgi:hypothetical protein